MSKTKVFTRGAIAAAVASLLAAPSVIANDEERVIVAFQPGAKAAVQQAVERAGGRTVVDLSNDNAMAIKVPAQALRGLERNPNVLYIEEDVKRELYSTEFEPNLPYGIMMVQADQVSAALAGNRKVCVIDSGYDLGHPDLQTSGVDGVFDSGTGNWFTDENGHGTHVTGTIAALANGLGVVGVVPNGQLNIHVVKVFSESGWAYSSSLIAAADQCANYGSNVINMSLGGSFSSTTERNAFQRLNDDGVLSVAAAGNGGNNRHSYPASYPAVYSVAAVDRDGNHASFSQYNNEVEIAAPGVDVMSTVPRGMGQLSLFSAGSGTYSAIAMDGSPEGEGSGALIDCGLGTSTCQGAQGNVCLMERGQISFADKVLACQNGGGVAAVVYNNESGPLNGTLGGVSVNIPAVGISQADGQTALGSVGSSASVSVGASDWASYNGTSMASPHVAGVAALVWSHFTECTNDEIRAALNATAEDRGAAGRDNYYGHGIVKAKAAYDYLTANGCAGGDNGGGDDDNGGDNGGDDGASITLSASTYKVQGRARADLTWSGADSSSVTIFRNGSSVATVANTGSYTDVTNLRGSGTLTYKVCEAGTQTCSDDVTVSY
ncbi:S8 family serine peptidase [Aliidiomarina halalkaliphila]|uniref:S8 family serine peptidase n=1 Tax=Aliidiomarina halalkaliphila TaxID=2593535 RepID=A0A552X1R0_9GAMM|nr:S8 family serine peptidase [Aliidiomarina halalkaliphila]TRW48533.1 S8 family serine peptidase [Aliidiomarina halalkaliphila]